MQLSYFTSENGSPHWVVLNQGQPMTVDYISADLARDAVIKTFPNAVIDSKVFWNGDKGFFENLTK